MRLMADCRQLPSEINCSMVFIGEEDEVLDAALAHAIFAHHHDATPELREQIRSSLTPATDYKG
jgi:hypothetical protein